MTLKCTFTLLNHFFCMWLIFFSKLLSLASFSFSPYLFRPSLYWLSSLFFSSSNSFISWIAFYLLTVSFFYKQPFAPPSLFFLLLCLLFTFFSPSFIHYPIHYTSSMTFLLNKNLMIIKSILVSFCCLLVYLFSISRSI